MLPACPWEGVPRLGGESPFSPSCLALPGAFFMVPRALYYERKLLAQQRGTDNPGEAVSLAEEVTLCT